MVRLEKTICYKHVCQGWASGDDGIICFIKIDELIVLPSKQGEEQILNIAFLRETGVFFF